MLRLKPERAKLEQDKSKRAKSEGTARAPRRAGVSRRGGAGAAAAAADFYSDAVSPATRDEMVPVLMGALLMGIMALIVCFTRGYILLYGDAVAHLGIARRILDTRNPGLVQLGSVWLPLPHLLMLPFVQKMEWWQNGLAGSWPSLACYVVGVVGFYRLCRRMLVPRWALVATLFYALNPNLLYLATTAMTEPLYLALMVWITLLTVECVDAIQAVDEARLARRMIGLGLLIFAAVFTRYDGWILGAAAWCVIAWQLWRAGDLWRRAAPVFAVFTLVVVSGPLLWLGYNQHFNHDPLDFLRGPYSAHAIEIRTTPPGARPYRGWHNPGWALIFFTRTAQVDAAAWEMGFAVMAAALAGLWIAIRQRMARSSLLLWIPLGFYVYSIAYGWVPIFIPQLYPHSYYNSRYGMEMLPALALFAGVAAEALERRWRTAKGEGVSQGLRPDVDPAAEVPGPNSRPIQVQSVLVQPVQEAQLVQVRPVLESRLIQESRPVPLQPVQKPRTTPLRPLFLVALVLVLVNPLAMVYGTELVQHCAEKIEGHPSHLLADYAPPLVLKEALVNSTTRIPFERNLALLLDELPPGAPILMQESDHIGALQDAGIPLRQTINESDYDSWHAALQNPAKDAAYVVAMDGDAVAKAVKEHPEGLVELTILCGTGQPCARLYQSEIYTTSGAQSKK